MNILQKGVVKLERGVLKTNVDFEGKKSCLLKFCIDGISENE